jgi:DNA-binding transcriptional MerR regulator
MVQPQVDLNTSRPGERLGLVDPALVPIDEVARHLGLRASAIRYYEQRGLVEPAARFSGRRWYDARGIRRLAIIRYWQTSGLMSLDEIRDMLAGPTASRPWKDVIDDRLASLRVQVEQMEAARGFLEHIRSKHEGAPDGCPHYEALIWQATPAGASPVHSD